MAASSWTFLQTCGVVGVFCAAWNLFGDLYFLDFYTAHLSDQEFAMVRDNMQQGFLFNFNNNNNNGWAVFVAQSGGWMYPVWAFVTAVPLYMGLQGEYGVAIDFWKALGPCTLMVYGLCVVGGSLHSAFAFLTVLPSVYHNPKNGWSDLAGNHEFSKFLVAAQTRIIQHIAVGCLPGYLACNVAGIWIAWVVHFSSTRFPKWFNLFNPIVTMIWIQVLGAMLPGPWGFYLVSCLGTWCLLVFNIGTIYCLWNEGRGLESLSPLFVKEESKAESSHLD